MPVVADSSFLVDIERGHAGARALLERLAEEGTTVLIPTIVIAEYLAGVDQGVARERALLLAASGEVIDFTLEDARAAAEVARTTIGEGLFPGWSDAFIAGIGRSRHAPVVTGNPRHFAHVETLAYR